MNCDVCGRNMTTTSEMTMIGLEVILRAEGEHISELAKIYPEIEVGRIYRVCYMCLLKSMGIKFEDKKVTQEDILTRVGKMLPEIKTINDKCISFYSDTVTPIGIQGIAGPMNELNTAIQYLEGAVNYLRAIAAKYDIKVRE